MPIPKPYDVIASQLESILAELDRLQLPVVAVHIDLALRRLEEVSLAACDEPSNGTGK